LGFGEEFTGIYGNCFFNLIIVFSGQESNNSGQKSNISGHGGEHRIEDRKSGTEGECGTKGELSGLSPLSLS
jgi:hypothetical protein